MGTVKGTGPCFGVGTSCFDFFKIMLIPLNSEATLGVLAVRVKAWFRLRVRASVSGKFGDPDSTKVPPSSVFDGSLARNGGSETSLPKVSFC